MGTIEFFSRMLAPESLSAQKRRVFEEKRKVLELERERQLSDADIQKEIRLSLKQQLPNRSDDEIDELMQNNMDLVSEITEGIKKSYQRVAQQKLDLLDTLEHNS